MHIESWPEVQKPSRCVLISGQSDPFGVTFFPDHQICWTVRITGVQDHSPLRFRKHFHGSPHHTRTPQNTVGSVLSSSVRSGSER